MVFSVGRPVCGDVTVTLATVIDSNANGSVGIMTGGTGVMFLIIGQVDKAADLRSWW